MLAVPASAQPNPSKDTAPPARSIRLSLAKRTWVTPESACASAASTTAVNTLQGRGKWQAGYNHEGKQTRQERAQPVRGASKAQKGAAVPEVCESRSAALHTHLWEREERSFMRVAAVWRLAEPRCTSAITSSAAGQAIGGVVEYWPGGCHTDKARCVATTAAPCSLNASSSGKGSSSGGSGSSGNTLHSHH